MRAYIIKRLLLVIPTVLLTTMLIFVGVRLIPGDIIDLMVGTGDMYAGFDLEVNRAYIEERLGLDVPVYVQYGRWMGVVPQADGGFSGIVQGNLGNSLWTGMPVREEIAGRLPISLELGFLGIIVALVIALPVGIYSAIRQDSSGDYVSRGLATGLIAVPSFWVALMVILLGSLWFGWAPPLRYTSLIKDPIENLSEFILPALVVGMAGTGTIMRMLRSMMLEVLRQDYIRTAWAKGLKERVVIMRHALKNALIPVVTLVGLWLPTLVGGTVIVEIVFSMPGMGRLLVNAITQRDYSLVSGVIFVYAIFLVVANLAIDLTYGYLDPRVHYK